MNIKISNTVNKTIQDNQLIKFYRFYQYCLLNQAKECGAINHLFIWFNFFNMISLTFTSNDNHKEILLDQMDWNSSILALFFVCRPRLLMKAIYL